MATTIQQSGVSPSSGYELPEVSRSSHLGIALIILELKKDNLTDEQIMKRLEDELKERIKAQSKTSVSTLKSEGWLNACAPAAVAILGAAVIPGVATKFFALSPQSAAIMGQTFAQLGQPIIQGLDQLLYAPYKQEADNGLQIDQSEQQSVYQPAAQAREDASRTASQTASSIVQRG